MNKIKFDFNNLLSLNLGKQHGVSESEIKNMNRISQLAHQHLRTIIADKHNRINLGLEWVNLPFQSKNAIKEIKQLGEEIARDYENVLFLGIGGSYLGLKAAQDALCPPYYNDFAGQRKKRPRIFFEGNNLDPNTLHALLNNLNPKKTFVVVISKSGETTETKAAFSVVENWLKKKIGKNYGRQIAAITDPESGALSRRVYAEQAKDKLSFRNLPLLKGVGGRFSELNIGLLHLVIVGINIQDVLRGAGEMAKRCNEPDLFKNPAYLYAALMHILYKRKHKPIAIIMPFCEMLKSTASWYVQLLAESLGKKYGRKIILSSGGQETWLKDKKLILNVGRTPIASLGTADLHSLHQNNIEGENNKVITFIRVDKFKNEIKIPKTDDVLSGKSFSKLLSLAQEATAWALVRNSRPNCTITLPEVSPYYWGGLIFFFEIATAFEGELLNVNAFDQPGVTGYKNYMHYKLYKDKAGVPKEVIDEIKKYPLFKNPKFII
jgi:glucose-6-phosphate isomerase